MQPRMEGVHVAERCWEKTLYEYNTKVSLCLADLYSNILQSFIISLHPLCKTINC